MGRPATIDDEKVLTAAREIFLRKGLSGTTAEVARRAGISQASIFKRYSTKQDLFLAAMHAERERMNLTENLRKRIAEVGLREALVERGVELIAFVSRVLPLAMVAWSNRGAFGASGGPAGRGAPFKDVGELVKMLEAEMRAGRLRQQDPWLVLRIFIAAVQHYVLLSGVFKTQLGPPLSSEAYMRGIVDLIWKGIGPDERPQSPGRNP
ncbi:MAG TPA: TetR/AcrR family transcriptional regulator [Myxococcales bacterium]|nr:TetR/AcrR family transcriptional regulator [Myxococcales bacterium]